jgi:hypothetical protein
MKGVLKHIACQPPHNRDSCLSIRGLCTEWSRADIERDLGRTNFRPAKFELAFREVATRKKCALDATIALPTVRLRAAIRMTNSDPTPRGYTRSLLPFLVPHAVIAFGFLPREDVKIPRNPFWCGKRSFEQLEVRVLDQSTVQLQTALHHISVWRPTPLPNTGIPKRAHFWPRSETPGKKVALTPRRA